MSYWERGVESRLFEGESLWPLRRPRRTRSTALIPCKWDSKPAVYHDTRTLPPARNRTPDVFDGRLGEKAKL